MQYDEIDLRVRERDGERRIRLTDSSDRIQNRSLWSTGEMRLST